MDERVDDLEVRMAFLEKSIEDLDGVVRELGDHLHAMRDELKGLREAFGRNIEASKDLSEERPPHW